MTIWEKHETALKELWENNAGNLTVDMVMSYLYEQVMLASQLEPPVMQKIADLLKKYDEKRIDLLHWRRAGVIPGGLEQTKLIEGFIEDLKKLSNFSA